MGTAVDKLNIFFFFTLLFLSLVLMSPLSFATLLVAKAWATGGSAGMSNMWLFFSVFLIFIGGMMILMLYMTSLSENEKPDVQMPSLLVITSLVFSAYALCPPFTLSKSTEGSMATLFLSGQGGLLWFLTFYLIFVLLLSVKMSVSSGGALGKFS